jgi:hypothetical protein
MLPSRRFLLAAGLGMLLAWLTGRPARGAPSAGQPGGPLPEDCPTPADTFTWTGAPGAAWRCARNWQCTTGDGGCPEASGPVGDVILFGRPVAT